MRWTTSLAAASLAALLLAQALAAEGPVYLVKDIETTGVPRQYWNGIDQYFYRYGSFPNNLTDVEDLLLFTAFEWEHGDELWRSDGTEAGTWLVKDLCPGLCDSEVRTLAAVGRQLFFVAGDGVHGRELWRSDGTTNGTVLLEDICPGVCSGEVRSLGVLGREFFFVADDGARGHELWKSDGTPEGTVLVRDICPGPCSLGAVTESYQYLDAAELGGALLFAATDGASGRELWRTDGTTLGTWRLADLCPGTCDGSPGRLTSFGAGLAFGARDATTGALWWTDGTTAGTVQIRDLCPNHSSGYPSELAVAGGRLFLSVLCNTGPALQVSDGTPAGTVVLRTYPPTSTFAPASLLESGGRLFFARSNTLWASDGTVEGTVLLKQFPSWTVPHKALRGGAVLIARDYHPNGPFSLWFSDGTASATGRVAGLGDINIVSVKVVDDRALLSGHDLVHGSEVWWSDGTPEGTGMLQDLNPGPDSSGAGPFVVAGSRVFFGAGTNTYHGELHALPRSFLAPNRCFEEPTKLCLQGSRFEVKVRFKNQHAGGAEGVGQAVPWSDQSGTFWFFNEENTELVVKILDGRALTGSFWVFYGALSNVEYWLDVIDKETGASRTYHNPPGQICGGAFLGDFPAAAVAGAQADAVAGPPAERAQHAAPLRLLDGRVEVSARWRNQRNGQEGEATVLAGNSKTGTFSFFSPGNIELVVKALDGVPVNGKLWFFYGALSDVEYWITLKDTLTGAEKTYHNPPGRICGVGDTAAL